MRGYVTVSVRSVLLAALVGLALVTAYLLGGQADRVVAPATAASGVPGGQADRRLVSMVGTGEASTVPDQISFTLTATARRPDLDDAMTASSGTMRRVLAELADHGVERSDVQTTGLSMHPEYEYHSFAPPTLLGYRVTQRARVEVDELVEGGSAISAAVRVGGDGVRVSGIQLGVGDPDALLRKARDAAVRAATDKAAQYAAATGQALGDVASIRELGRPARPRPQSLRLNGTLAAADVAKSIPIRAGRDDVVVRVQVVWVLDQAKGE